MTLILDTVIPGKPPGINDMYFNVAGKGRRLTTTARKWKKDIGKIVKLAAEESYEQYTTADLRLEIMWFWPNVYARDVDGPIKLVMDAVCEALGYDDKRVVDLHVVKLKDGNERFAVLLETIT